MSSGRRVPSSLMAPSPTATTLPFCGFSLAVSGRTMPLAVVASSSIALTISRSPRGFSFIRVPPLSVRVLLAKSRNPALKPISAPPGCWHSHGASAKGGDSEDRAPAKGLIGRQQPAAQQLGDPLAAGHHPVVIPLEGRPQERCQPVHPGPGRAHVPLVENGGDAILLVEPPAADSLELARRAPFQEARALDPRRRPLELDPIGQQALPDHPRHRADVLAAGRPAALFGRLHPAPPARPARLIVKRLPDRLARRLEQPGGEERVLRHRRLVVVRRLPVADVRLWRLGDLREADHRDRVLFEDRAAVDLLEELALVLGPAELGVVVLDVAAGKIFQLLHLDIVDDRGEDLLARAVAKADGDPDDLAALVLVALVAEPDRGRLAAAFELIDEDRRVEVEYVGAASHSRRERI